MPESFDQDEIAKVNWKTPDFEQTDKNPVVCINYDDAEQFCKWLSKKEGKWFKNGLAFFMTVLFGPMILPAPLSP